MTAIELTKYQTGLDDDAVVKTLVKMAEERIRNYLGYNEMDPLPPVASTTADIATILYQRAKATKAALANMDAGNEPIKSESYSEGGISTSYTYESASEQASAYDLRIANLLEPLKVYKKGRVVLI